MSYDQLDKIADSYIPLLLILFLGGFGRNAYLLWPNWRVPLFSFLYLIGLLVMAYGLMFFDNAVRLWPAFGLDYSTHTAVSLSLVAALIRLSPALGIWLLVSFVGYLGLMLYQQYHSLLDILSTALVMGGYLALLWRAFKLLRIQCGETQA